MNSNNFLCLDVGERRIGVARASTQARLSEPLLTMDRRDALDIIGRIKQLASEHQAELIVVGLPRGMSGQETAQTASVRQFAKELEESGLRVELQDEAATSLQAKDELKARGKPFVKGDIDKLAATYILKDWLEAKIEKV